jgi:hypothetical protein
MTIVPTARGRTATDQLTILAAAAMPLPTLLDTLAAPMTGLTTQEAQRRVLCHR